MNLIYLVPSLLLACIASAAPQADKYVITVGKEGLTQRELDVYATRGARELRKSVKTLSDVDKKVIQTRAVDEEVLFQAAIAAGELNAPNMRRNIIGTYKSSQTTAKISPNKFSSAEIKAHYDAHRKEFMKPVSIKFAVLVFPKNTARAELQKKMSLAMRTPDKVTGWKNTAWTEPGETFRTPLSVKQTAPLFRLRKGRISRLLRDSYGSQYLFLVKDRREAKQLSFAQSRAKVVSHMISAKQSKLDGSLSKKLRSRGARGKSAEDLLFDAAIAAKSHRVWHTRQRVINTYVHGAKKSRDQLLPGLRRRYRVGMPPR